nr:hypothetical protein [Tanacetum cinerariifolium]
MFLHLSLKGKAKEWPDRMPPAQITTWDQLVTRFHDYFFHVGRTSILQDMILRFKQGTNEPIKSAWICFQDLIKQVRRHGIQKWLLGQIFYDNISSEDQGKLDQFTHFHFSSLTEEEEEEEEEKLTPKEKRPREFHTTMSYRTLDSENALADLRSSINLMPYSIFWQLSISKLKPTRMSIQLADRSIKYLIGVCEDLLVKINKFIFSVDFVVLKMDENELVLVILRRPFPASTRSVIDVHEGRLSLRVDNKIVTFNNGKSMKSKCSRDDYLYCVDHTTNLIREQWVDTVDHDEEWIKTEDEGDLDKVEDSMEVFMDDFSIFGGSFNCCLQNLEKMLKRFEETNLVLNWEKCHFMVKEGIILGHKVSGSGIEVDQAKSRQSLNYHIPQM